MIWQTGTLRTLGLALVGSLWYAPLILASLPGRGAERGARDHA